MLESVFQRNLILELKKLFPGCIVMKTDPEYRQGMPDLVILYEQRWAALECKRAANASHRPNQDYWVNKCDELSFGAFIYPENKEEILNELTNFFVA